MSPEASEVQAKPRELLVVGLLMAVVAALFLYRAAERERGALSQPEFEPFATRLGAGLPARPLAPELQASARGARPAAPPVPPPAANAVAAAPQNSVMESLKPVLKQCAKIERKEGRALSGKIVVTLTVSKEGLSTNVVVTGEPAPHAAFSACMKAGAERLVHGPRAEQEQLSIDFSLK